MFRRSAYLLLLLAVATLIVTVACGGDAEEEAEPTVAPVPTNTAAAAAVAPTVAPTAVPPTAAPVAMFKPGSSIADIMAGPEIGSADTDIFNKNRFGGVIRWVPQGSVGNMDSMFSASAVGRGINWHFQDLLASWNAEGVVSPDLADSWTVREDSSGAHYTFVLRDGRKWHEGGKPLPEDVEASIQRWMSRDTSFAPIIEPLWQSFEKVDDDTFIIHLSEPTGILMTGLGYVGGLQVNMMPKALVDKYPDDLAQEFNGSAPYMFRSWDPGNEIFFDRFDDYVPRTEEPGYRAGAEIGYFDQMHIVEIPDQETRVAAVVTGEVDALDVISGDFYEEAIKNSDKVAIHIGVPGAQPYIGMNASNPILGYTEKGSLVRQAIAAAVNAEDIMKGYGDSSLWFLCPALMHCGTPWGEPTSNPEFYNQNNPERARALLEQAGYAGEEIRIVDPTDFPTIHPIVLPLKEALENVGMNVKVEAVDWAGALALVATAEGWDIFTTWASSAGYHPLFAVAFRTYAEDKDIADAVGVWGYPVGRGYEIGDKMEQLRKDFVAATDRAGQIAVTKKMSDLAWADPVWVPFGQFYQLRIYDKDIMDVDVRGAPVGGPMYLNQWWSDAARRAEDPR